MSACFFSFSLPGFDILDFLPIIGLPALPSIPTFALPAPVCLLDEF